MKSYKLHGLFMALFVVLLTAPVMANRASVVIVAPDKVKKGSDVTITLEVSHNGNNFMHHISWVYIKVNGIENKKWEFGAFSRPESENFTRTVTLKADMNLDLESEANCNIHGSAGIAKASVQVQ